MSEHNIGVREAVVMTVLFLSGKVFLPMPRNMAEVAGTAGWIVLLLAGILSSLTVMALLGIFRRYPDKSLMVATEAILGPYVGTLVNIAYFLGFFIDTFLVLRQFSEDFAFTVLIRTPLSVVIIILLIVLTFVAYQGVETIGRLAWVLAPLILGGLFLLLMGGLMTYAEPKALAPYLGKGLGPILVHGVTKTALYGELLLLGVIAPAFRKPKALRRSAWLSLLLSTIIMTGAVIIYFTLFPYPASTRVAFPMLSVSRLISVGRWISRVEGIFLINWVLSAVLVLSLSLFSSAAILSQVLRLRNYRFLFIPLAVLCYSLSLLPPNLVEATTWAAVYLRSYGGIVSVLLPMLTLGVAWVRGKEGGRRATG